MRITKLELSVLEKLVVVSLTTDEGLVGNGFAQKGRSVAQAIAEVVRPQVVGEDPFDYERIWHKMLKIHADRVLSIGLITAVPQPVVVNDRLRNLPEVGFYNWDPGSYFGLYHLDAVWLDSAPS